MLYKLIQRALPGWFPYNSLNVMQPMFTKDMNREIAEELGTTSLYTEDDPKPPQPLKVLHQHAQVRKMLNDSKRFHVPFNAPFDKLLEGRDFSHFMLCGDMPRHREQRNVYGNLLYGSGELKDLVADFIKEHTDSYLSSSMFPISRGTYHVDIIKE